MRIGVLQSSSETPPQTANPYNTATAFMVGYGDSGPVGTAVRCLSIGDVADTIGARSATNQELWDDADVYFRVKGSVLYISRLTGPNPVNASLTLQDAGSKPTVAVKALYPGSAAGSYQVAVTTGTGATFTASTASSTTLSSISSFAGIGPGTLVAGTGIPNGTYIVSVNQTASTAVLSQAATATATGVTITPGTFTVAVSDLSGQNATETHGPFINTAALYADTSSVMVGFSQSSAGTNTINSPAALSATALTGGTDDRADVSLTTFGNALAAFTPNYGPGQVSAPGITNTTLPGVWSALGAHAATPTNNRVAICDMDDGASATALISALGSFGSTAVASYCGFWAGRVQAPGVVPGTTRTVAASAVVSALCAQADATGNSNQAAAFDAFPPSYITGFTGINGTPLYGQSDIDKLNEAGINTWNTIFGVPQNYGFVSAVSQTVDAVYWQFSHSRFRMALEALFAVIGQPFVGPNITALDITALSGDLANALTSYVPNAISNLAPDGTTDQGFVVDTSANTPTTMAAGQLLGNVSVRMAPFAQLVELNLNAVPTTQSL